MHTALVVIQVLVAVALVGLVLIQHGKGADAGAAFGSGASGTVFGARGAANFLTRTTAWLAAAFFASSLALAYLVSGAGKSGSRSVVDSLEAATPAAPAATAPAASMTDTPVAVEPQTPAPAPVEGSPEAPKVPQ